MTWRVRPPLDDDDVLEVFCAGQRRAAVANYLGMMAVTEQFEVQFRFERVGDIEVVFLVVNQVGATWTKENALTNAIVEIKESQQLSTYGRLT